MGGTSGGRACSDLNGTAAQPGASTLTAALALTTRLHALYKAAERHACTGHTRWRDLAATPRLRTTARARGGSLGPAMRLGAPPAAWTALAFAAASSTSCLPCGRQPHVFSAPWLQWCRKRHRSKGMGSSSGPPPQSAPRPRQRCRSTSHHQGALLQVRGLSLLGKNSGTCATAAEATSTAAAPTAEAAAAAAAGASASQDGASEGLVGGAAAAEARALSAFSAFLSAAILSCPHERGDQVSHLSFTPASPPLSTNGKCYCERERRLHDLKVKQVLD